MNAHRFEAELRSALADRAAGVPDAVTARLGDHDYHPRSRSRALIVGLAGPALVSAGVAALVALAAVPGPAGANPHGPVAARHALKLASYSFTLPARAHVTAKVTASTPACHTKALTSRAETVRQAGGAFVIVNGGCLHADLGPAVTPQDARPVAVGTYHGLIVSDRAARRLTLYVIASAREDLVFTATRTGLSASQLIAIAVSGLPPCSATMEYAPPCLP